MHETLGLQGWSYSCWARIGINWMRNVKRHYLWFQANGIFSCKIKEFQTNCALWKSGAQGNWGKIWIPFQFFSSPGARSIKKNPNYTHVKLYRQMLKWSCWRTFFSSCSSNRRANRVNALPRDCDCYPTMLWKTWEETRFPESNSSAVCTKKSQKQRTHILIYWIHETAWKATKSLLSFINSIFNFIAHALLAVSVVLNHVKVVPYYMFFVFCISVSRHATLHFILY